MLGCHMVAAAALLLLLLYAHADLSRISSSASL
jgi:hypothetical protein